MTCCETRRSDPLRKREQLAEAEAPVAADARVRRLAAGVSVDERLDDRAPELLAQIERDVWDAEPMARLASRDHRRRRTAGALRVGALRIEPEPERHADGAGSGS